MNLIIFFCLHTFLFFESKLETGLVSKKFNLSNRLSSYLRDWPFKNSSIRNRRNLDQLQSRWLSPAFSLCEISGLGCHPCKPTYHDSSIKWYFHFLFTNYYHHDSKNQIFGSFVWVIIIILNVRVQLLLLVDQFHQVHEPLCPGSVA